MPAIYNNKVYYSISELSYMLRISKEWIHQLIDRWKVDVYVVGRKFYVPEKDAKRIAKTYGVKL